jgi:hypothetical protein
MAATTDHLTTVVSDWVTQALRYLEPEKLQVVQNCLGTDNCEIRVVVRLKEGAVLLEATKADERLELYRQDVEGLRQAFLH